MRGEYGSFYTFELPIRRFTPTCVGNTANPNPYFSGQDGSPPHAWGIHWLIGVVVKKQRFTPTCVGNTQFSKFNIVTSTVHPHMRGEYLRCRYFYLRAYGSPPHAWGILVMRGFAIATAVHPHMRGEYVSVTKSHAEPMRFTPTCVGNTYALNSNASLATVHPHMRGEYVYPSCLRLGSVGSPPHAWGIRNTTG